MQKTQASAVPKGIKATRLENERLYGQPLPRIRSDSWLSYILWALNPFSKSREDDERVIGVLDISSRSVWVYDEEHQMILWKRGFFGKGNLSRSEPTWLKREINRLQIQKGGGKGM
jgi:tRNA-splicing endonuclease subunit Sen2